MVAVDTITQFPPSQRTLYLLPLAAVTDRLISLPPSPTAELTAVADTVAVD
jgi:hypothetical protein